MPQLIQLKNRIKAVQTIEKITHAMRLIAMSVHVRLRDREPYLHNYKHTIEQLFRMLSLQFPTWQSPFLHPTSGNRDLIILVSSQKGLCGNFNIALFSFFKHKFPSLDSSTTDFVCIGKKASDFVVQLGTKPTKELTLKSSSHLHEIAHEISEFITHQSVPYRSVVMLHNYSKTFFVTKQKLTTLVPFEHHQQKFKKEPLEKGDEYMWEEDPTVLLDHLARLYIAVTVEYNLFASASAEQAARFVSMDSSTRNARRVLETMQHQYNKLRQAKITRELTELSSSFQLNIGS